MHKYKCKYNNLLKKKNHELIQVWYTLYTILVGIHYILKSYDLW